MMYIVTIVLAFFSINVFAEEVAGLNEIQSANILKNAIGVDFNSDGGKYKFLLYSDKTINTFEDQMCHEGYGKMHFKTGKFSIYTYNYNLKTIVPHEQPVFDVFPDITIAEDAIDFIVVKAVPSNIIVVRQIISCASDMFEAYGFDGAGKIKKYPFIGRGVSNGYLGGHFSGVDGSCIKTISGRWCLNKKGEFRRK